MEPQLPPVGPASERGPVTNHERAPVFNAPNLPETAPVQSVERERGMEQSVGDARGLAAPSTAMPVAVPVPIVVPQSTPTPQPTSDSTNPATAADDDLIEKEWVNKAKQVVQATKDDPYEQEKQVGQLMADYVRKRYGKEVGKVQE